MVADTPNPAPERNTARGARSVRVQALLWALGVSVALSVISMAVPALVHHPVARGRGELRLYLDVLEEGNLPTWWSTALLVGAALLHALVGVLARSAGVRGAWAWFVSAGMLGVLSLDEHTSLHERLDRIGRKLTTFDSFPFYWLLPGLIAGAVAAAALLLLARQLRGMPRWCLIAGCGLLLGSALGGELLQGLLLAEGEVGPVYVLTYHAEELGENIGVLLLLASAMRALCVIRYGGRFTLHYAAAPNLHGSDLSAAAPAPVSPQHDRIAAGVGWWPDAGARR